MEIMLGQKTSRKRKECKEIELIIEKKKENFETISYKLDKADELFTEYEAEKTEKRKWKIIKRIVEFVEINPKFNYELLKLNKIYDKKDFEENFKQLAPTLSNKDYYSLTGKNQENPATKLFDLLNLYITNEKQFDEKTKLIINNKYNIPLIEGNEKIRINYYFQSFSHYEVYLNDKQKKYILDKNYKIRKSDEKKLIELQHKYEIIKRGIKFFEKIIPKMKNFFNCIELENNNLNIKIFTFLLYITDINPRIKDTGIQPTIIKNLFMKEIDPTNELIKYNSLKNIIKIENKLEFPENYGIKKKYDNSSISNKDKEKDKKMNEYIIYNEFESIEFDGRNYVINNLINDFVEN